VKSYSFEIVIEKGADDAGYSSYTPHVQGCLSNGKTWSKQSKIFEKL
jgi:predicted RNase H-like HicB family nuclease